MDISEEREGNRLTVTLAGELNTATAPYLQEALENEVNADDTVVFDMADLTHITSARVFVGPHAPKVVPFESAFLSGNRALFQPQALLVREEYLAAGFLPERCGHVPDDFIGLELDFLAKLAQAALDAWGRGSDSEMQAALSRSAGFLDGHLLKWVGPFADFLHDAHGDCFYARFARFAQLIAEADGQLVSALHL